MSRKPKDYTNKIINNIIPINMFDKRKWNCICSICNNELIIASKNLSRGHPKCKFCINLVGKIFADDSKVLQYLGTENGGSIYLVQCRCGRKIKMQRSQINKNQSGCKKCFGITRKKKLDLQGKKFGDNCIVESFSHFTETHHQYWNVKCGCGKTWKATRCQIKNTKFGCRKCGLKNRIGENAINWNDKLSDEYREERRKTVKYFNFIKSIYKRDNFSCLICKSHKELRCHHLDAWKTNKDKRYDPLNCITLCDVCHRNFHSEYGVKDVTRSQFIEFIGREI